MIDFAPTDEQRDFAASATALAEARPDAGAADATEHTWRALAAFGALDLLTAAGGGDPRDLVALMGGLGAARCPGPVVASIAAGPVLTGAECDRLAAGDLRVTVAVGGFVPWAATTDVVLEVDGDAVWRVDATVDGPPVATLSGEPWWRADVQRVAPVRDADRFVVAAELGLAAAVLGLAGRLLDRGAAHARTREQFGRPIGGFQGVAHPLAESWARVTAGEELVRLVAVEAVAGRGGPARSRLARAQAVDAALHTAYAVHQAMGGLSFAEETGIGALSTRIRQWSLLLPDGGPL